MMRVLSATNPPTIYPLTYNDLLFTIEQNDSQSVAIGDWGNHESALPCCVGECWPRWFRPRGRRAPDDKDGADRAGKLLRQPLDLSRLDRRRLSALLRAVHPLRDARRRAHVQHQRRALEPRLRQRHPGADQQAEQRPEMAVVEPNNINQSVIGVKMSQPIANGWSLIGTLEAGFDPFPAIFQLAARAGHEQRQAASASKRERQLKPCRPMGRFAILPRLEQQDYGTITAGRVNALSLDGLIAYDPMGSAYAFSPFGFTGMYAGFSDTELARSNTRSNIEGSSETSASRDWLRLADTTRATVLRRCGKAKSARTFMVFPAGRFP